MKVQNPSSNVDDVQRGHWRFATSGDPRREFTHDAMTLQHLTSLINLLLSLMITRNFVNAVQVKVRWESTPVTTFLASIFGMSSTTLSNSSCVSFGFAASLDEFKLDEPIAICKQSITEDNILITVILAE